MTVIAGNAFPDSHPEIEKAQELGVEVIRYHEFLGNYMQNFISIGGDGFTWKDIDNWTCLHMSLSGHAPTSYLIGDGTGKGLEDAEYFVFEACEYKRHFLRMILIMQL